MNKRLGSVFLGFLLAIAGLAGCTSMQLAENNDGMAMPPSIVVGDRIRVLDSAGLATELEVTVIGSDFVEGKTESDEVVRVALADVQEFSERRVAWGKTALLAVGINFLLAAAVEAAYVVPVGL